MPRSIAALDAALAVALGLIAGVCEPLCAQELVLPDVETWTRESSEAAAPGFTAPAFPAPSRASQPAASFNEQETAEGPALYDLGNENAYSRSMAPHEPDPTTTGLMERLALLTSGRLQLEGGYSYLYDSDVDGGGSQHAFPDMLLRYGLTDRLELRLSWPGYVTGEIDDPTVTGRYSETLDPSIGLLYDLWCEEGLRPQTAVLVAVPVTLEGNPFALQSLQPLAELWYTWSVGDGYALSGRSGIALFDTGGDEFTQFQQSISVDTFLSDRIGAAVSWDMVFNHGSARDAGQHMATLGLSYLVTDRLSLSWGGGVGLNSAAPDFLADFRFAHRF